MVYCEEYAELISAAIDGALSPDELEKLNAHLSACPACRRLYTDLTALHTALAELPPAELPEGLRDRILAGVAAEEKGQKVISFPPKKSSNPWRRWLASAAVLALVVLGTWSWKPWETGSAPALPRSNETAFLDRDVGSTAFTTAGAAPAAPIPAPTLLPDPAAAPAEAAAKAEKAAPTSENPMLGRDDLLKPKDAVPEMGSGSYTATASTPPAAAPSDSDISALSTEGPEETIHGFTSVGQAPDATPDQGVSLPEESPSLQSNILTSSNSGNSQPTVAPRLFSIAPAAQYVPFPGEEGVPEQSVASQAEAVTVLANYIYEFVGEVELVEDGLAMNYTVNSPTGISGTVACVGEDEEVYFLNYQDELSPEVFNYSVRKDSGQVTLLSQETPAEEIAAP